MKTLAPYSITQSTAVSGGYDITGTISSKGIIWDTQPIPASDSSLLISTKSFITTGVTTAFIIQMTGLVPNTRYYVRAFATSTPNLFGGEFSFVTKAPNETEETECTTKEITIKPGQVYNIPPDYEIVSMEATAEQAEKLKSKCPKISQIIEELKGE
jgi:hypothetical protein